MRIQSIICSVAFVSQAVASISPAPSSTSTTTTTTSSTTTVTAPRRGESEISVEDMQMLLRLLMLRVDNVIGIGRATRPPATEAPRWVVDYFNRIAQIATSPEHVITVPRIENQVRVIGQDIYRSHGHEGMVAVCEYNRQYKAFIERAWDGIGRWMA
jgi:hypothetical protein